MHLENIRENLGWSKKNFFEIYPNPATDIIVVECEHIGPMEIVNETGEKLILINSNNHKFSIDISSLTQGNYIIKNVSCSKVFVKK